MIITYADGTERSRVVGLRALQRRLRDLGDDDDITRPVLDELLDRGARLSWSKSLRFSQAMPMRC